mgnify:CR=1 FL=1
MKTLMYYTFLFLITLSFGQNKLEGKYFNNFGDSIILKDSIYTHKVKIEQYLNTYVGTFKKINDTLIFNAVYDLTSLRRNNSSFLNKRIKDSLIQLWKNEENDLIRNYVWRYITPTKMVFKKNKLYLLNSKGELDLRKFMKNGKKHRNYFTKAE